MLPSPFLVADTAILPIKERAVRALIVYSASSHRSTEPGFALVQFGKPCLHFHPRQISRGQ